MSATQSKDPVLASPEIAASGNSPHAIVLRDSGYHGALVRMAAENIYPVERVQTGVRIEKRLLKVLKAFAEYHDLTLGDLLEGIVLHTFDGKCPFSPASLARIKELKKFYALDLDSSASHRLTEIRTKKPRRVSKGQNL